MGCQDHVDEGATTIEQTTQKKKKMWVFAKTPMMIGSRRRQ